MKLKQWIEEQKQLREERLDMIYQRFTAEELIRYRNNCLKDDKLVRNSIFVLFCIGLAVVFITCMLGELSVFTESQCDVSSGYMFGISAGLLLFCLPSGTTAKRLTEMIEKKLTEGEYENHGQVP